MVKYGTFLRQEILCTGPKKIQSSTPRIEYMQLGHDGASSSKDWMKWRRSDIVLYSVRAHL